MKHGHFVAPKTKGWDWTAAVIGLAFLVVATLLLLAIF